MAIQPHVSTRRRLSLQCWLAKGAALLLSTAVNAMSLDDLRLPMDTAVQWVGRSLSHNGLPIDILRFDSTMPPAELIQFIQESWDTTGRGSSTDTPDWISEQYDGWEIISRLVGRENLVLQARGSGTGSTGFVSLLRLQSAPDLDALWHRFNRALGADLPRGWQPISITESQDEDTEAMTALVFSRTSSDETEKMMQSAMRSGGWAEAQQLGDAGVRARFWNHRRQRAELLVSPWGRGQSLVFVNIREL